MCALLFVYICVFKIYEHIRKMNNGIRCVAACIL